MRECFYIESVSLMNVSYKNVARGASKVRKILTLDTACVPTRRKYPLFEHVNQIRECRKHSVFIGEIVGKLDVKAALIQMKLTNEMNISKRRFIPGLIIVNR